MARVLRGETWSGDFEVRRRDGSTFPAHVVDAPIFASDGSVVGIVGVSTDISDLVREREHLQKANRAKDEFISLVSHELKSPITTIVGNAAVLRRAFQSLDAETIGQALQDIEESGERLDQIVDDLLVLARLDQGEEVETEPLILFRFAEGLVDEHRKRFPHRTITLDAAGDPRPVLANEFYLGQVIRNLIGNAEKYSPADEPIALNVERTTDEVRFTIRDRGTGIPVAEQTAIFEPFYRSRASRSAKGVGIGLTVCRRLMDAQHGKIWVRNHEDGGAEFGISVPIDPDAVDNDENPAQSLERQNGQR
jgi:two-component system OmpR family sensor kinase